jgi:hypothetical protein
MPLVFMLMSREPNTVLGVLRERQLSLIVRSIAAVLSGAGALLFFGWVSPDAFSHKRLSDFSAFYSGGALAGDPKLYDATAVLDIQQRLGFSGSDRTFIRPPYYAAILSLLSRLPYPTAFAVWQILNFVAGSLCIVLLPRDLRYTGALITVAMVPTYHAFYEGQDAWIVLLLLLSAYRAMESRPLLAGLVLSLAAIKFHLLTGVAMYLLANRLWTVMLGGSVGTMMLWAFSTYIQGAHWISDYVSRLRAPGMDLNYFLMPTFYGALAPFPGGRYVEVLLSAAALMLSYFVARRGPAFAAFGFALCTGVLIAHHAYPSDCILFIPLMAWAMQQDSPVRAFALCATLLPIWLMLYVPPVALIPKGVLYAFFVAAAIALTRHSEDGRWRLKQSLHA